MVREPRPGRISLGRSFQCNVSLEGIIWLLRCADRESVIIMRGSAPLQLGVSATIICATRVLCSNCENMCSNCAPMDPLAVVLAARGGEAEKLHQQRMSAAVKVHVLQSIQVRMHNQQIHNQQHNHNFSSLFFLSDTTSLEINCHKPNFW